MLNASMYRVKEVELLDAMCGTGKSHNLFKFISLNPNERFIYVTPMLSEVANRAAEELAKHGDHGVVFCEPTGDGFKTKGDHLLELLDTRQNAICTHALFQQLGERGRSYLAKHEYIVIVDEELGMIEPLKDTILPAEDRRQLLKEKVLVTEPDGRITWMVPEWGNGKFAQARKMAEDGSLYSNKDGTFFTVQLPVQLFAAAKRVIVATYMYEGSVLQAFLKIKGIGHKPFWFEGMELRNEKALKQALLERIEFCDMEASKGRLYRQLGIPVDDLREQARDFSLSATWYQNTRRGNLEKIANHIRGVARHMDARVDDLIYTMPSSVVGKKGDKWLPRAPRVVKIKSYSAQKCFLHKGARATNEYETRTSAIHAYNRYPHPAIKSYLQEQGTAVNDDSFALAELIQWFFRTAIRVPNGPKVKLHIVSPRMDKLFKDWLYS